MGRLDKGEEGGVFFDGDDGVEDCRTGVWKYPRVGQLTYRRAGCEEAVEAGGVKKAPALGEGWDTGDGTREKEPGRWSAEEDEGAWRGMHNCGQRLSPKTRHCQTFPLGLQRQGQAGSQLLTMERSNLGIN